MKRLSVKILSALFIVILLLIIHIPATAQYETGYYCYQCPVCGTVFKLTAYEVASTSPYALCPVCGSAYAGTFIQVSCQDGYTYSQGYGSINSNIINGSNQGSYHPDNTESSQSSEIKKYDQASNQSDDLATKGKILMIVAPKDYREEELNVPRDYFRSNRYKVVVSSKGVNTATSMNGETTPVDLDLKDVKVTDYSAIIFVGGEGIYNLKLNEDKDYINVAKAAGSQKKLIGAICLGPWILADAGLLNGKKATASDTEHLKSKGAIVSDKSVVKDGNIITGNGPDASEEFAIAIIDALEGTSPQSLSQEGQTESNKEQLSSGSHNSASSSASPLPKYKCTKCFYVYDPSVGDPTQNIPPGTPFDKLPSTWKCPWCGSSKSSFVNV